MKSETAVPVAEAAKDFLRLLDWVESGHSNRRGIDPRRLDLDRQ